MSDLHHESWWDSLRHFGLLLSPTEVSRLDHTYARDDLPRWAADQLRRELMRFDAGELERNDWVALLLERACGFDHDSGGSWQRGRNILPSWSHTLITKESRKPTHLWTVNDDVLPVFSVEVTRLGVGRGRKIISDCVQWLRAASQPLALVTNGRELRLIYAGLDFDAGCEWATDLWFEEGRASTQLHALRTLLQPSMFTKGDQVEPPLLAAILASRRGQAELSSILGERVREAVELLVQSHRDALSDAKLDENGADIYRAAVRVVMRLVVVLFAESRELLPRSDPNYHNGYGLGSLFEQLNRLAARGRARLGHRFSAWPRILSLFQLIFKGSQHPSLLIPAYGGELFAQGYDNDVSTLSRALHVFETGCFDSRYQLMPDTVVHQILELLTRTEMRIRQGRSTIRTSVPVDFSDLSSEYIGILYEGLLDYELRTAPADNPIVFLAIGDEPALHLARLESMEDKEINKLFEKLKNPSGPKDTIADVVELEQPEDTSEGGSTDGKEAAEHIAESAVQENEVLELARARATEWARKAVLSAGLIRKPRPGVSPEALVIFEDKVADKARQLVRRVVLPGDWYLVRWGGTRKGAGTFYTRPTLAVPTVQKTLRPLVFNPPLNNDGQPDENQPYENWIPKTPEEILSLKICDPSCGSGSFPVTALRFLTEALFASLYTHKRLDGDWRRPIPELLGLEIGEDNCSLRQACLPCPPDSDDFAERTKAILRRYIVERCIYGVDFDPLGSELCRLSLWIETMDRDIPFSFLDHKIKVGNSLVGCWLERAFHYPALAWFRNAGDKGFLEGVTFECNRRDKDISRVLKNEIRPQIDATASHQQELVTEARSNMEHSLSDAVIAIDSLHSFPYWEAGKQSECYRTSFLENNNFLELRNLLDKWCSVWFWPTNELATAPRPKSFQNDDPVRDMLVENIANQHRFFHWEIEFPDVFNRSLSGFDAIIGNPPWDTVQAESEEFFSHYDPLYRTLDTSAAKKATQREIFRSNPSIEADWVKKRDDAAALNNYLKAKVSSENTEACWRSNYDFLAGSKTLTFRAFVERAIQITNERAQIGLVVPSAFYSDSGSASLRRHLIEKEILEQLTVFQNGGKWLFDMHSSYKVAVINIFKCSSRGVIDVCFDFSTRNIPPNLAKKTLRLSKHQIELMAPSSYRFLELSSAKELSLANKIANMRTSSPEYIATFSREFNVSTKGKFLKSGLVPVYDGKNIHQFNPCFRPPKFFTTSESLAIHRPGIRALEWKLVFREVARGDDSRTMIATILPPGCSHTYNLCSFSFTDIKTAFAVCGVANSFAFDWFTRRIVDKHTSTIYQDLPWPDSEFVQRVGNQMSELVALSIGIDTSGNIDWHIATDPVERFKIRVYMDYLITKALELDSAETELLLSDFSSRFSKSTEEHEYILTCLAGTFDSPNDLPPVQFNVSHDSIHLDRESFVAAMKSISLGNEDIRAESLLPGIPGQQQSLL